MPANAPIVFNTTGAPAGYCPDSWNRLWLDFAASLYGYLPGNYSTIIISETEPAAGDRDKAWLKLDVGGNPVGWFKYANGAWIWPNQVEPNSIVRQIVEGSDADIWSLDGGDGTDPSSNAPTSTTGAMWEEDINYRGRMPLGAGTLSPSSTVVAVGDTGGVDQVTQTSAQMAVHAHDIRGIFLDVNTDTHGAGGIAETEAGYTANAGRVFTSPAGIAIANNGGSGSPAATQPMNTISPYRGVKLIKRTARQFYTP